MPDGAAFQARQIADLRAERDLARRGAAVEQVELIDELARRLRDRDFTAREIIEAAQAEQERGAHADLAYLLGRASVLAGSARSLGRLLEKLEGEVVRRIGANAEGVMWRLDWPRRCWRGSEFEGVQTHTSDGDDAGDGRRSAA
jgi:hypothetical protein